MTTTKLTKTQLQTAILVLILLISGVTYSYLSIGIAPLVIIGVPSIFAYYFWYANYLRMPKNPAIILPAFLATVAGFEFHIVEEYLGNYAQAISRIFNFAWTANAFVVAISILTGALSLVAIGLYYRKPIAGFIATLFIMTRFAEILLFIFPFIKPQIQPENPHNISKNFSGIIVTNMPNYYYSVTGEYYFPGMYTWVLTLVPAIYFLYKLQKKETVP